MLENKVRHILLKNDYDFLHTRTAKSTMFEAQNYIKKNDRNCIFLSDHQSEGRGQRGNIWQSPVGNIYCSISFDNFLKTEEHFLFSILVGQTIKMSLEYFDATNIFFKWPNDIFYEKKKFAGIINEILDIKNKSYIVMGFGINFSSAPKLKKYNSTYIKSFCNVKSIDDFLFIFIKILFANLKDLQSGKKNYLISKFSESLMLINEKIKIILPNDIIEKGIFRGINKDGSLKLEKNNKIENIYSGSIRL